MKLKTAIWTCSILVFLAAGLSGCASHSQISKGFYARHSKTADQITRVWGDPVAVQKLDNGMEKRFYAFSSPYIDLEYRYFLIAGDRVLLSGLANKAAVEAPVPKVPKIDPEVRDISKKFYENNPRTVEQIEKVWGQPIVVHPLEGGLEKRLYAFDNPYTSIRFRFFLAKNGQVISAGITDQAGDASLKAGAACTRLFVPETSARYWQKHPKSAAEIERVWGQPLEVHKAGDGEWRIYKMANPYIDQVFGYRYFEVQNGQVVGAGMTDMVQLCD